ncbi:quinone oxidoreductase family protein [Streptomyces orinoci]|uniref:Zinc-binding dehydrogenase n=1 Tax=Streptomyces orinoci TaxID=67339 RepID=A0ABV3K3F3_STRON|nr:zinc-binding dehydrogenase [Streptomyces orinoci]
MRAVVMDRFGGPEVLRVRDIPEPVPGEGEFLVDVTLAGVNYADLHVRQGSYRPPALPAVPGAEVVGRRRGDGRRVAALLRTGGGYAQVAAVRAAYSVELPEDIDDRTAAALLEQGCTAHAALVTVGRLAPGESVAVSAAAGGVGHLAVQLALALGASTVVGIASTEEKRELVRKAGARHAIASPEEVTRVVPGGVGLYLDSLGGPGLRPVLAALAPFGRLVYYGHRGQEPTTPALAELTERSLGLHALWMQQVVDDRAVFTATVERLFALVRDGRLAPHLDRVAPLSEAAAVHRAMAGRRTKGKVLLEPGT